ncbi:MAG: glycosyltransferase family 2 protein [Deltaproteobacteria bacterium]|nr:glycosyltransferase family 2 protein [Deltaproteobacteria bacterium]
MDISIIIVNWNTEALLRNCLKSVYDTMGSLQCEIIVVDNNSHDRSVSMVKEEFPDVVLISNSENRGFAAANNQGFAVMQGRYALLLNSDTVVISRAVHELLSFMESNPDAGMAGGQLLNEDGSRQNSIANFPTLLTMSTNLSLLEYLFPGTFPSKRYDHPDPIEIESAVGACLMVRKEAMDTVGWFDEGYFFFFEETDWAHRMRLAGWRVYHVPAARVIHLQGQSIGHNVGSRIQFYRSRYRFLRKWHGPVYNGFMGAVIVGRLVVNWLFTLLATAATVFMNRSLRGKLAVYSRLILWHLKGCPDPGLPPS